MAEAADAAEEPVVETEDKDADSKLESLETKEGVGEAEDSFIREGRGSGDST